MFDLNFLVKYFIFIYNYNVGAFPEDSIILVYEDIDLNIEEEEREGGGILIKSNSKYSSISNILKRIKI